MLRIDLKELRTISRLTQEDVADLLCISRPQYSYMERNNNVPLKYQQKLYEILGYKPDQVQLSGHDLKQFRSGLGLTRKSFSQTLDISHSHYIKLETMDVVPEKYSDLIYKLLLEEREKSGINVTIIKQFDDTTIFETLDAIYVYSTSQDKTNKKLNFLLSSTLKKIFYAK